jgi:hypothetical protein
MTTVANAAAIVSPWIRLFMILLSLARPGIAPWAFG